jgi:hypothetical protein
MRPLGDVAYEAYRLSVNGRSVVTGDPLPVWLDLPEPIRAAWRAAAGAVVMYQGLLPGIQLSRKLRWHYGPTANDPDPGRMWCYDCGGWVVTGRGGTSCTDCGRSEPDEPDE